MRCYIRYQVTSPPCGVYSIIFNLKNVLGFLAFIFFFLDCKENDIEIKRRNDSNRNLYILLITFIAQLIAINYILSRHSHELQKNKYIFGLLLILCFMLIITCVFLGRRKQNVTNFSFQVPCLPWIPLIALFFNIYLMMSLNKLTWYRLVVWMVVGKLCFFAYDVLSYKYRLIIARNTSNQGWPFLECILWIALLYYGWPKKICFTNMLTFNRKLASIVLQR